MLQPTHQPALKGPPPLTDAERERRDRLAAEAAAELVKARERLRAENLETENGLVTALRFASAHDHVIKKIHQWAERVAAKEGIRGHSLALVAQGGYGRRQLNLHSDIDILFLLPAADSERAELELRLILYALIDLKFDLGHAARTPDQAVGCVGVDIDSATALIDARLLAGDRGLYEILRRKLSRRLHGEGRRWLIHEALKQREARYEKHGMSVYMLQPNVKEGEGGLRDLHVVSWFAFAAFGDTRLRTLMANKAWTPAELRDAREGRAFLLRLRNELHAMEGRRFDVLRLERQHQLAVRLGYAADELNLPEETMVRDYYLRARIIHDLSEKAIDRLGWMDRGMLSGMVQRFRQRRIHPHLKADGRSVSLDDRSVQWFRRHPRNVFEAAAVVAEQNLEFSPRAKGLMRRAALRIDEAFRASPEARDLFLRILASPRGMASTVRTLHDTKVLEAYLPEWAHLFCLVRSDLYHSYTVDEHHLKCLEASEELRNHPEKEADQIRAVVREARRWDLLNFALLLHDVGKGLGDAGAHALLGAQVAERVGMRIGLSDADRDLLRFLVKSHLKMSHAAQRRDLFDDRVIRDFAREVGDIERLQLLYLHTICDFRGVGLQAYNDWRAQLLVMLYDRAEAALKGRPLVRPERPTILPGLRAGILRRVGEKTPPEQVDQFLESLPDRYIATVAPDRAADHFLMSRQLAETNRIEWRLTDVENANYSELRVAAYDVPGTLANICGALASKDINILSAQVCSTTDGFAIDTLQITDAMHNRLPEGFRLDRLKQNLNEVMLGQRSMASLMERSRRPRRPSPHRVEHHPPRAVIDNDSSDGYTIVEIFANDRTGLLYDITRVLHDKSLSIDLALITTASYQVVDVFYVTDVEGNKIHGELGMSSCRYRPGSRHSA
ncbi:MAG: [protein-PII] uridylyltransferase [Candidatus Sumerlaeota bacterium]|nr:[protein-PII] uridylyltransferase [Candidatus Sumerlaeota bacterium]